MNPEQRNDFLTLLGLGPRDCADCGASFTPPPYHDCQHVEVCPACGYKRFEAFCETEEGQKQLKEAFDRIAAEPTTQTIAPP